MRTPIELFLRSALPVVSSATTITHDEQLRRRFARKTAHPITPELDAMNAAVSMTGGYALALCMARHRAARWAKPGQARRSVLSAVDKEPDSVRPPHRTRHPLSSREDHNGHLIPIWMTSAQRFTSTDPTTPESEPIPIVDQRRAWR